MMMSENERETEFLERCLGYDDNAEHQTLAQRMTQLQRDERCVRRAVWLMVVLTALAVTGLGYAAVLIENFSQRTSHLIVKIVSAVGLASMISLLAFAGLRLVYRLKLKQRREECRLLVTKLLDSRLGQPATTPWRPVPRDRAGNRNRETNPLHTAVSGFPHTSESTVGDTPP